MFILRKIIKKIIAVIISLAVFVAVLLLGVRAYFRLPVADYYANSEKAFVIPGINDGIIHQGLAYFNGTFYVTGYRSDGEASEVRLVDEKSGEEIKRIKLLDENGETFTGHVGGITVTDKYVYVADKSGLVTYLHEDFENAKTGDSVKAKGVFSTQSEDDKLGVAFVHSENGYVYVGEFYREENYPTPESHKYTTKANDSNTALILAYKEDSQAEYGISDKIEKAYSIRGLVQGMCFDGEGRICLSTSYATAFSHIYIYGEPSVEGTVTVLGQEVERYVLDSSNLYKDIKIAPMSEEIVFVGGKMYVMCESATDKYIFGKFTSAKYCYATDTENCGN